MKPGELPIYPTIPSGVSFASVRVGEGALVGEENRLLSPSAGERRRRALGAGRTALHRAISEFRPEFKDPILRGDSGQPLLPSGIFGSISHSAEWAVAVATDREDALGLGIDLQVVEQRELEKLSQRIASAAELEWLSDSSERILTLFSVKEAIYKALYPRVNRFFGFREVELFPAANDHYEIEPCAEDLERALQGVSYQVLAERFGDYILSGVYIFREQ